MKIIGTGMYVPPRVETAKELASKIGRSEQWIISRTGVAHRHIAEEPMEVMAAHAALEALGEGPEPDLILNASTTARQLIPDSSVFIQQAMGLEGICSFTIHATCLSFLVALHTAAVFVNLGAYHRVLIVSSEVASTSRNFKEPESAALFGDGAAAVVVEPTPEGEDSALLAWGMRSWPQGAQFSELRGGGIRCHPNDPRTVPEDNMFHMDGTRLYKMARRRVGAVLSKVFQETNIKPEDLDLVIPHQASKPAISAVPHYGVPLDKVVNILADYGNCIAASITMALAVANQKGVIHRNDLVMLVGMGAGLSIAIAILRW